MMEIVKMLKYKCCLLTLKGQTVIEWYIKIWFEFQENEYGFMLGRLELVKKVKMVKCQNVDFWLENPKFDENGQMTILLFD